MKPTTFRVLIVDDEQPARQRLLDLLVLDPEIGEILQAKDGVEAVQIIRSQAPDLVFLDVQMPELDGWGVLRQIGAATMPLSIFVTAHDQHALRAFEANALDYLLKPFSDERFAAALSRVKVRLAERNLQEYGRQMVRLLGQVLPVQSRLERIAVKSAGSTRVLRVAEIDWIEASGVYVTLHAGTKSHLHRASLQELSASLDPQRFVRVHRSAIVNIDSIVRLESVSHGEFDAVLKNGARARVSRSYRDQLERVLGQPL